MDKDKILDLEVVGKYKETVIPMLRYNFPNLSDNEIEEAVNYSVNKRMTDTDIILDNSYKNKKMNSSLVMMAEYIMKREPIITAYGVMFKKHAEEFNPIAILMQTFMEERNIYKSKMFEYPKGSEMFEKYNLDQLLSKIDANALYGSLGNNRCIYYNLYSAATTTSQGQLSISISAMAFEAFLANNVKFRSLDEIIEFINNILKEDRVCNDNEILDRNIEVLQCFDHLMHTCGHGYAPTQEEMNIVWEIVSKLGTEDINRIFYKNNLFAFIENTSMTKAITYILQKLDTPYLNPNIAPDEIKVELESLWELIEEYVVYNYGFIDPVERLKFLPRACVTLTDTDSYRLGA